MKTLKRIIIISQVVVLLISSMAFAQNWQVKLSATFGGANEDVAQDITVTSDKGFIIAGDTKSLLPGYHYDYDIYVVKLDYKGDTMWTRCLGGNDTDHAVGVVETDDKGYLIAGYTRSEDEDVVENNGSYDYWLVKLNSDGDTIWTKNYGGSGYEVLRALNKASDGGYIVTGKASSNNIDVSGNNGLEDIWVLKLNSEGDTIWTRCFGGSNYEEAYTIVETSDNGFITAGYTKSNNGDVSGIHGESDYWVVKMSETGEKMWARCYGGSSYESAWVIEEIPADTGYIVAGKSQSSDGDVQGNHGSYDIWLLMLNASGDTIWTRNMGGSNEEEPMSIQFDTDTTFILVGTTSSDDGDVNDNIGNRDYWLIKFNISGDTLWTKCLGGTSADYAYSGELISKNSIILAGKSQSNDFDVPANSGNYDFWIVEYGCDDHSLTDTVICEGDSILAQGQYQKTSGYYCDTLTNQEGCDSLIFIKITVIPKIYAVDTIICEGQSYFVEGEYQTVTGIYYDSLINVNSCDSIIKTSLTVNPFLRRSVDVTICEGDVYYAEGANQSVSGIYYDTITNNNSCDSIITTNLSVEVCNTINEGVYESTLKIYPVPANRYLNIDVDDFSLVQVFDITGKLALQTTASRIDFSGFEEGLYYLRIINTQGKTFTRKIVYKKN